MICRCLVALSAALLVATSSPAASMLLEGFESFNDGDPIPGLPLAQATTGPGVTEGSLAAESTLFGDNYQKIADINLNVTIPDTSIAAGNRVTSFSVDGLADISDTGGFTQIVAGIFFGSDSSFSQIDGVKTGSGDSFLGTGTTTTTFTYDENGSNFDFGSMTSTPVLPIFDKINADLANGDFVGLGIYVNNGGASGSVTVDNVRANVIPEPASAVLVATLALPWLTRRRG